MKLSPMLAYTGSEKYLDEAGYLFEPKLDGIRALCYVEVDLKFISRNGIDLTKKYPEFDFRKNINATSCILDGEIIAYDENGNPSFTLLQQGYEATFVAFDILMKNNQSLLNKPLIERKGILETTVKDGENIEKTLFTKHGRKLWQKIAERNLEGVMAKKEESIYQIGVRTRSWLKIKIVNTLDCVIVGYTSEKRAISSLAVALYDQEKRLKYIGRVGTGFSTNMINELHQKLKKIEVSAPPVINPLPEVRWVKPKYVCEITYRELTHYGILRHTVFLHLRPDKKPADCTIQGQLNKEEGEILKTKVKG